MPPPPWPRRNRLRARLADKAGPTSRLKVRFAPPFLSWLPMVWGDYWVLDLTDDYGAALVGTAAGQGFDVARLVRSGAAE